jgi:hypothetical protein
MKSMKTPKNPAEAKLAKLAWKIKLFKTSVEVTRTPVTTLRSLLLDAVKNDGPRYVNKLENKLSVLDSALGNSEPLVKKDPVSLRVY